MKSKYQSPKSVAKNQTVPISADDPRVAWNKIGQTKARQGAEIDIVGLDGKSLVVGGINTNTPTKSGSIDTNQKSPDIIIPPINGEPPAIYPGQGPVVINPTSATNLTASWSGEDLVVQFNWDYSNELNKTVSQFILNITADGVTRQTAINSFAPNKTQSAQTITFTKLLNTQTFGVFTTNISQVCVIVADPFNNISSSTCYSSVPAYVLDLPTPTISVTAINNGYSVAYTTPTQASFNAIEVVEYESDSSQEPTGVTYTRSYFGSINPANIIVSNLNKRWIKARFASDGGLYTNFSIAYAATPTSSVGVDLVPPNEVVSVSAHWSGDDIVINYTLPSTEKATRIQLQLTAPNNLVGYFYRFPDGTGNNQSTVITKKDLYDQFGEHYSSFSGVLKSIDTSDNRSAGVSFLVPQRANTMSSVTPTFTLTPLTNGYSVFATNYATTVGVNYMEVYAKSTTWAGLDPVDDEYVVYSGANPAVIINDTYANVYVKIHYYDDFGNTSLYSAEDVVVPLSAGAITSFETPISFGTNAVIYAGGDYQSGKRTVFKSDGIFAYDGSSTTPTTQIIANANAGTPTFITTEAKIADWHVSNTLIENTLDGAPSKYVGLSATGEYSFWAGSDTSGGDSSANFTVTPTGNVVARNISIIGNGNPLTNLISAGGLFSVKNNGALTATSATITGNVIAQGGQFTGNVKIDGGSLYAPGSGGSATSGKRVVFNGSGVTAYNGSGGYAEMLTTPLADGSVFATTAANIGGWSVSASSISKTAGNANISLDSTNGYIYVSNSNVATNKAGINSPSSLNDVVFWAGANTIPSGSDNPFRVTLAGKLYAKGAEINGGAITSTGSLGTVKIDGVNDLISITSSASGSDYTGYLFPRNKNIFLTSGNPFIGTGYSDIGTPSTGTTGIAANPYFAAGSGFVDRYGSSVKGVGIYTGAYTGSGTKPFISATTTGIEIKASEGVSFNAEPLTGTNPGITITSGTDTTVGAITIKNQQIILQASGQSDSTDSPYVSSSKILLSSNKVQIFGLTAQGNADITPRIGGTNPNNPSDPQNGQYRTGDGRTTGGTPENLYPLGKYGRQRTIVQSEYTGELLRGMAVYYVPLSDYSGIPSNSTGVIGDLLVQW